MTQPREPRERSRFRLCASRWTGTVRNKFQLALLVPARPRIARGQRVGPKPVGPARPFQAAHLDKPPYEGNVHDKPNDHGRVGTPKPISKLIVETGSNDEGNDPPAALVAIVKPLDRGGRVGPPEDKGHRNGNDLRK